VAALRADLHSGQRSGALRRAHTLKSLSASIGMDRIAQQAAQLEADLRSERDVAALQDPLDTLETELQAFLQALAEQLPPVTDAATPIDSLDAQAVAAACSRLGGLLADDNLEAVECLGEHEALLKPALGAEYAAMADAVRRFDCALALSRLQLAAQSKGIGMTNTTGTP
jgi:HPt (histidine-containing phosphotransfer) domain-containing protein